MATQTRTTTHTFTVRGRGLFPFDMLRYDRCTPKTEADSAEIERTTLRGSHRQERSVTLIGPKAPTEARWASFGWTVERWKVEKA